MAYVPVPKDLNAVKTKVLFNLTKRQLVCFGSGAAVGVPLFFLLRQSLSNSAAAICMIVVMLPFFLFGFKTGHDNRFGILYFQQFFTDLLFLILVFQERNPAGNKSFIQFPLFFLQFKNLPVKVSLTYSNGIYLTEIR